ncbi:MAG TPA: CBS domain-containing protein [Polyangiales bacterium]|nr:CBS domain-containing protein [Polyangiales bacterium]
MNKPVVTCQPSDGLDKAAGLMWDYDCGVLPVTNEDGTLVGMITDRDICMATYTRGLAPREIPVRDAMSRQVFACRTGDSIEAAESLMRDKQVRRVPVLNGSNEPVGMLSLNDVARYATSSRKKNGAERALVETLSAISQPRPPLSS